jgi:ABC-type multidrug transport system permease subunit
LEDRAAGAVKNNEQGTDEQGIMNRLFNIHYSLFLVQYSYASFVSFFAAGVLPVVFFSLAGLDLPKEPLKVFPFLVFLSPLPMLLILVVQVPKKMAIISPETSSGLKIKSCSQLLQLAG